MEVPSSGAVQGKNRAVTYSVRWCRASFLYLVSLDYVIIIAIIVAPEELPSSSPVINTFIILGLNISASDTLGPGPPNSPSTVLNII